jgi:hypothetical protein
MGVWKLFRGLIYCPVEVRPLACKELEVCRHEPAEQKIEKVVAAILDYPQSYGRKVVGVLSSEEILGKGQQMSAGV